MGWHLRFSYTRGDEVSRIRGMSDQISIAAFDDEQSAEALARKLSAEGLDAISNSDSAEQLLMFYNAHPRAQHHVTVPGNKLEAALQWLNVRADDPLLQKAIRCPDCGSTRVEYPQFSRKTIIGSLPAIGAALGLVERQFYCSACHFMWPPPEPASVRPEGGV